MSSSMTLGRPPWLPLAAAACWPSRGFSRMYSRSSCAATARTANSIALMPLGSWTPVSGPVSSSSWMPPASRAADRPMSSAALRARRFNSWRVSCLPWLHPYEVARSGQTRYLTVILIVVFAPDGAASPDLRERTQLLVLLPGEHRLRHPTTSATPKQTRQNVAEVTYLAMRVPISTQLKGISVGFFVRTTGTPIKVVSGIVGQGSGGGAGHLLGLVLGLLSGPLHDQSAVVSGDPCAGQHGAHLPSWGSRT